MTLLWGSGSAPCWRVMIALEEKNLQGYNHKLLSFDKMEHKSQEVLDINPRGQVPSLLQPTYQRIYSLQPAVPPFIEPLPDVQRQFPLKTLFMQCFPADLHSVYLLKHDWMLSMNHMGVNLNSAHTEITKKFSFVRKSMFNEFPLLTQVRFTQTHHRGRKRPSRDTWSYRCANSMQVVTEMMKCISTLSKIRFNGWIRTVCLAHIITTYIIQYDNNL